MVTGLGITSWSCGGVSIYTIIRETPVTFKDEKGTDVFFILIDMYNQNNISPYYHKDDSL